MCPTEEVILFAANCNYVYFYEQKFCSGLVSPIHSFSYLVAIVSWLHASVDRIEISLIFCFIPLNLQCSMSGFK